MNIGVVGPCASGKTTLIASLREFGYTGKHIAQEHSYVPNMWKRLSDPDILIYLDVSYECSLQRQPMDWTEKDFKNQVRRLQHAKEHSDLYLNTDRLTPDEVLDKVLNFLHDDPH